MYYYELIDRKTNQVKLSIKDKDFKKLLVRRDEELYDDEGFLFPCYLDCDEYLGDNWLGDVRVSVLDEYNIPFLSKRYDEIVGGLL